MFDSWERNELWHWNFVHWESIKYIAFLWKNHAENVHQKLAPNPFLILLHNPKQPLHARIFFKNKILWKRIIKKPWKSQLYFFFETQSLLMDRIIKNNRGLELVTSRSSHCETSSKIFLYSLYIIWPSLMI